MSPPEASTPSSLMATPCGPQLWPVMLCRKRPSGFFHFFMLSALAETEVCSSGEIPIARTAFLWFVRTADARPATRSITEWSSPWSL